MDVDELKNKLTDPSMSCTNFPMTNYKTKQYGRKKEYT